MTKIFTFLFSALSFVVVGQRYIPDHSPDVIVNNSILNFPWAGGLNSAQINTIDLNSDNLEDIIAFEKSTLDVFAFIATDNGTYEYAPELSSLLPEIYGWMITRDFNGDGKKDIFTAHALGMQVYINNLPSGFDLYPVAPILTSGNTGPVNIYVSEQDLPAIEDIDNDGDLDIITMQFAGTTLEYHKNQQVENNLKKDTLVFQKETENWGDVRICGCSNLVSIEEDCPETGREEHSVGHSLLLIDLDGDEDLDLGFSDNSCYNLRFVENTGTTEQAVLGKKIWNNILPGNNNIPYPSPSYVDVDHDGIRDLVLSPNNNGEFMYSLDFSSSVWVYKNGRADNFPDFTLAQQDFLQREMIDVGRNSYPLFYDMDNDSDLDMYLGKLVDYNNGFRTGLSYYENIGTYGNPIFELITHDSFLFSVLNQYNIKPQFVDVTGDRRPELVYSSTGLMDGITSIYYFQNIGKVKFASDFEPVVLHESIPFNANFLLNDVDDNNRLDLIMTTPTGVQRLERRNGSNEFELIEERFLGLPVNTHSISTRDIDNDETEDFVYSVLNKIFVVRDFKNNSVSEELEFSLTSEVGDLPLGNLLQVQPVYLLGNDVPELVVGKNTGGVNIYKAENALPVLEKEPFVVLPTSADQKENMKFEATHNMLLYVTSTDGKVILGPEYVPSYQEFEVQLRNLATGMYIINAYIDEKTSWQKKFVVVN